MDNIQIILVGGLVVMALINAVSLIWAFYLDGKLRQRPTPKNYDIHVEGTKLFSEEDLAEARTLAQEELRKSVEVAAEQLQRSVSESAQEIAGHINEASGEALNQELEKYRITLSELHAQAIRQFGQLQQEIDQQRTKLIGQLEEDVKKEQERRVDHFNERINEVVASYIAESLGDRVDLGAQGPYILQVLQKHKEDIKQDILA